MPEYITFENVGKTYKVGEVNIPALHNATFSIKQGEICVIVGASGAGKTTVLNILGGMDTMTKGKVWLDGTEISSYNEKQLTAYRRYDIGFVFQFYNLIPNLTALENVEMAVQIKGVSRGRRKAIEAILNDMKLRGTYIKEVVISHCQNIEFAEQVKTAILNIWNDASVTIMPTRGLCSYYAERGGLIIGF